MKQIRTFFIVFFLCFAAYSCVEPKNVPTTPATKESYLQAGADDSRAIGALCEGFSYALEQSVFFSPNRYGQNVTVSKSHSGGLFNISFDFKGMCNDGVVRSGNIMAKIDSIPWKTGSKIEIEYIRYSAGGATFTGRQNLAITRAHYTDTLPPAAAFITCFSSVKNASLVEVINKEEWQSSWSGEQEWEWMPRQIFIDGSGSGTTRHGFSYSYSIVNDMLKPFGCKYISEGVEEMVAGQDTATIDFDTFEDGDTCDRLSYFVYITFRGSKTEEKLPY
jgi:hypothetical protein